MMSFDIITMQAYFMVGFFLQVFISGTFTDWKTIPMVKSHGDFVTIIDLPEGEHQYKYFVDGEWRNDPQVVSSRVHFNLVLEPAQRENGLQFQVPRYFCIQ